MPTNAVCLEIDGGCVIDSLQDALAKLENAEGELVLDFSHVHQIEMGALTALQRLAGAADAKGVKLALSGVNVDVYRVLKLAKLAPRFSFPA